MFRHNGDAVCGQNINSFTISRTILTSALHVRQDNLLTYASECRALLKQLLVVLPLTHGCQKLHRIAHQLLGSSGEQRCG